MRLTLPEGSPQADQLTIELPDSGQTLDRFESYAFDDDWTVPCAGFHFTIGGKENPGYKVMEGLVPGAVVQLKINGIVQDTGYIDDVVPTASRSGGKRWTVTGRNALAPVVSGGADPFDAGLRFSATNTLEYLITNVFGRYGFIAYAIDDAMDRSIKTGLMSQRFSKKKGKLLKRYSYGQQLKPQPAEGSFEYIEKIIHRAGFYVRCSADGKTIIVATPDYEQAPTVRIVRHLSDNVSNVLDGGIGCRTSQQPSVIVATGFSGGGEWPKSQIKSVMVNELVGFDPALLTHNGNASGMLNFASPGAYDQLTGAAYAVGVGGIINENPDAKPIPARNVFPASCFRPLRHVRGLFLHDQDARTQAQLDNFVRAQMSRWQHLMWAGEYLVHGHTYFDGQASIPWTVNTIADVDDEDSGPPGSFESFTNPMWIKGRTYEKSRQGTFTRVRLILPYTLDLFSDYPDLPEAGSGDKRRFFFGPLATSTYLKSGLQGPPNGK